MGLVILFNFQEFFFPKLKPSLLFFFGFVGLSTEVFPILPSILNIKFDLLINRSVSMADDLVRILVTQFHHLHSLKNFLRGLEEGFWVDHWKGKLAILSVFVMFLEKILRILGDIDGVDEKDKTDDG